MKSIRVKVFVVVIALVMIIAQLPSNAFIYAQENGMFRIDLTEGDIYSRKIEVNEIKEGITKVALHLDGKTIETKDVNDSLTFDVYINGAYEVIGYDEQGAQQSEETIKVTSFDDLTIEEDATTHQVKIVSRHESTEKIKINDKEIINAIETHDGYFEVYYDLPNNGDYSFTVLNLDGKEVASKTLKFSDVPNINKTGEIVLSNEDDLKQIIANPSSAFIMDEDIQLTSDVLKDVNFTGTLDGQGYTLSGITDRLFNSIHSAKINNIVIEGKLAETSTNSTITNAGFYVEASDEEEDIAVILNSENTTINNSFALMNVEGKIVSGFLLNGTGEISNSYVSGYLSGQEVYGFGKEVNVYNSYITASLTGEERVLFSNGENETNFYDAQINDLEDSKSTPFYTKDMVSGALENKKFIEIEGRYPEINGSNNFKAKAQSLSTLSVLTVKTESNLSALEDKVETEEVEHVNWVKNKNEITAESNDFVNRFALKEVKTVGSITIGTSTDAKTTQITYPTTMGTYYKILKASDTAPTLPTSHKAAIDSGWKVVYWAGSNKESSLDWNTEYSVYSTDLTQVNKDGTIRTAYGNNGGKLVLSGTYDFNEIMTATMTGMNTTKGILYWETADTLNKDATWAEVHRTIMDGSKDNDTYTVTNNEASKYLRARFVAEDTTGYQGSVSASTDSIIKQEILSVTIENKTIQDGTYTLNDRLIANITPVGKENEVMFQWFHEGENADTPIATGRNYEIKGSDVGKKLYVKAVAKQDGEFKNYKDSIVTEEVQPIECTTPVATNKLKEVSKDDITVTLTMDVTEGLYRYGYTENGRVTDGKTIQPYSTLARNNTNTTITGLKSNTTYYFYVQQVGENGYADSEWSDDYLEVQTDNDHVKGDAIVRGENIYKETLTASMTNTPSAQTGQFVWYRLDHNGRREATPIASNIATYTLVREDIGRKIEVVYEGTGNYSGEVSTITDMIRKEEKSAPDTNLTLYSHDDTTISVTLPTNSDGEKYIIGISSTKDGVPIEQLDDEHKVLTFSSGENYTITGLNRDTTYFLFVRYAENDTHQKSEWIKSNLAVSETTDRKTFSGQIDFSYETRSEDLMKGQMITANLTPADSSFNFKGTWKWYQIDKNNKETVINNFSMTNDKQGTTYILPEDVEIGTKYKVSFEANVGYTGSVEGTSTEVKEAVKQQYGTPNPNDISMEAVNDTSIKVKMTQGEGQYRFFYKKADQSAWDSITSFFNELFNDSQDGFIEVKANGDSGVNVFSNVDVIIDGLDRNSEYIVRVQRVGDDKGTASEYAYSTDATIVNTSVTTEKTEIAGYVSIEGTTRYDETLTATYNEANYASTGSGSDTEGTWEWYRGNTIIAGASSDTYQLVKADIGEVVSAKYTMPDNHDFTGSTEAKTTQIKKALSTSPKITKIEDKENASGKMTMLVTGTASANEENIYYRLQKADALAPTFPTGEELSRDWKAVEEATITIDKDADDYDLEPNVTYNLYFIKTETETEESSSILSEQHKIGTYKQTGTITFDQLSDNKEAFVVGQTVKATMTGANNDYGTWKWYMSTNEYNGADFTTMPDALAEDEWEEITSGFSPMLNGNYSELSLTEDMFAHFIRAEFVADTEKKYSGTVSSTESQFVKKVYEETLTLTSSTKDGYGNLKAYTNSVITATVNNYVEKNDLDRDTVRFKIGSTYITSGITLDEGVFTYTMPNNQSYDEQEVTAEVSTPKITELYVGNNLKNLTATTINSKTSTNSSMTYTYGIPISNADDLENFMKCSGAYTNRNSSSSYVMTANINMSSKGVISYSGTSFAGTLNGDYHTIVGIKNQIFGKIEGSSGKYANVKNLIFSNITLTTSDKGSLLYSTATYCNFNRIMITNANLTTGGDGGFLGGYTTSSNVNECISAGGSVRMNSSGEQSVGGLVGYMNQNSTMQNNFSINTELSTNKSTHRLGTLLGCNLASSNYQDIIIKNNYAASKISAPDSVGRYTGGVVGEYQRMPKENTNNFYDATISPASYLSANSTAATPRGIAKSTQEMIGDGLKNEFGDSLWTYRDGYYPVLTWVRDSAVSKLYTATRGAFTSLDGKTSTDDMFNGNIRGSIQIPTEFQTKDYTVSSSDSSVLKVTDSGTIIPVGSDGDKATITITYTEPDVSIGGSSSNTYEFTVKETMNVMSNVSVEDENGNTLSTSTAPAPKMNQVLTVASGEGTRYQWYRRKSGSTESEEIIGATNQTYTIKPSDVGYEIGALVSADAYAPVFTVFTNTVVSIKPEAPSVTDVTDSSVELGVTNGNSAFTYEFGYMRADQNAIITQVDGVFTKDDKVNVRNLQRNKVYNYYVRIAAADDASYPASEWSNFSTETTRKTELSGTPQLGKAVNNGSSLSLKMEIINGQNGTWSLQRMSADGNTKVADIAFAENTNDAFYTLSSEDVGYRIKATFTGSGDFEGSKESLLTDVIEKTSISKSNAPVRVSETDTSITVKMNDIGTYDIAYADKTSGELNIVREKVSEETEVVIDNLLYNKDYYIYARYSETDSTVASPWSDYVNVKTLQHKITGTISEAGEKIVDKNILFQTPSITDLTGTWKLERVSGNAGSETTTTISPNSYGVENNILTYKADPKDAGNKLKATFTGNGDFKDFIAYTTGEILNNSQDDRHLPTGITSSLVKEHSFSVKANDGTETYQFGYALKGNQIIQSVDATVVAGTDVQITGLKRNSEYDIYVRKASKVGYDASDWVKITTQKTDKSTLTGTVEYVILDGTTEKPAKVGVADIGVTYKATYLKGTYDQIVDDTTAGHWQWYANDVAIEGANTDTYTIEPMEGEIDITVKYIANDDCDFKEFRVASIGTLTKPAYDAPTKLPTVIAEAEDGEIGSRLKITSDQVANVFYYVQKSSNEAVPITIRSSEATQNAVKENQWFKAEADMIMTLDANTEYVVYAAKLEDGEHGSSGVISQRVVKTVKEDLSLIDTITIIEADNTDWKVLQNKELRISINEKSVDGVWQYYVTQDQNDENSWQNITSEIKNDTEEGTTNTYSYTKVNVPLKYSNGYYVRAIFIGRGDYEGFKTYTSSRALIGTQIKGRAEINSGDTSEVFVPITVNYIYAKENNADIIDEQNGTWVWYRETAPGSDTYEKIDRDKDTVGIIDSYTPTSEDVGKKIYAVYTAAVDSIYSGSVQSNVMENVQRATQSTPDTITVKQVNGTNIQINLPSNMLTAGKTIAQPRLEYTIKGEDEWQRNGAGDAWINDLKANTEYEIRVRYEGTSEYEPSPYGTAIIVNTDNQSFDEDNLTITEPDVLEVGAKVTATFSGKGYDEGYFIIKRSDGTVINDHVTTTATSATLFNSGSKVIEYEISNADSNSNIVIQYKANDDAATYGGYVEKSTKEVAKPLNPTKAGTPTLETIEYSEETLKVNVNAAFEYVFNESATAISEASGDWEKLEADNDGYYTFTNLSKTKDYYLHVRTAENENYRYSAEDVSAPTKPWTSSQYTITYENMEGATNGTPANPTQYTELTADITLRDASKAGYTFLGWTTDTISTPTKGLILPTHSSEDKAFTANWDIITYDITYNLDGGTVETANPATYDVETADFTLLNPTKKGYTFLGWSGTDITDKDKTITISKGSTDNRAYTANWEINTYTITYDLVGGTNHADNPSSYQVIDQDILLKEPSKTGHRFLGWKENGVGAILTNVIISSGSAENFAYTAVWEKVNYKVIFDSQGGSQVSESGADYQEKLTKPIDPTKEGYTLTGWFKEAGCINEWIFDTDVVENTMTLYAKWTINQYTAKFDGNGGSDGTDIVADYNSQLGVLSTSTRTGYTFNGWYTEKTGGNEIDETTLMSLGGKTYYAQWTINQYTATFKSTDNSADDTTITKDYDAELGDLPEAVEKDGYDFKGWFTTRVGGTQISKTTKMPVDGATYYAQWTAHKYTITYDLNDEGSRKAVNDPANKAEYTINDDDFILKAPSWKNHVFTGWTYEGMSDPNTPEMNVTISKGTFKDLVYKANWKNSTYTITFDSKGGSEVENQGAEHDGLVPEPSEPTKDGHAFIGWFKDVSYADEWNFDTHTVTGNFTLYAKWQVNEYTATFDANGGESVAPEKITKNYNEALGELPTAIRVGYTFVGWFTEADGGTQITKDSLMPIDGATYYAQWTINEYTIKFDTGIKDVIIDVQIVGYDKLITKPEIPEKTGYKFIGWYSDKDFKTSWNFETNKVKRDMTLYAKYEEVKAGNIDIVLDKDSPIHVVNKEDEIAEAVLTQGEYNDYLSGKNIRVRIECKEIAEDLRDFVKEALDGQTPAKYYDISIYKTVGDEEEVQVDKLRNNIKIVLNIPKELYPTEGISRVFHVLRIHKEQIERLNDLDRDEKTVTIESSEFSTYVLCYKDTDLDTPVIAPIDKSEGTIKNPGTSIPSQTPSSGNEETPDKKGDDEITDTDKETDKEESKNNIYYYFLIPIGVLIGGCIGCILKIKKKK